MNEVYKIVPHKVWDGRTIHLLTVDNITLTTCNPKKLAQYLATGATLEDSAAIEKWLKYNNL